MAESYPVRSTIKMTNGELKTARAVGGFRQSPAMNLKLKRIAPLQAGKMLAAFYGLMALVFVPFMMIFMALGRFAAEAHGASAGAPLALPLMLGMGVGFMLLLPFLYAAMGFIFGVIAAFV